MLEGQSLLQAVAVAGSRRSRVSKVPKAEGQATTKGGAAAMAVNPRGEGISRYSDPRLACSRFIGTVLRRDLVAPGIEACRA